MKTTYEFVVETLEYYDGCGDDPDIVDTSGFDSLDLASRLASSCDLPWRVCLRRDTGSDDEGITERYYAYPSGAGFLPDFMETCSGANDGPSVPAKYRNLIFPVMKNK